MKNRHGASQRRLSSKAFTLVGAPLPSGATSWPQWSDTPVTGAIRSSGWTLRHPHGIQWNRKRPAPTTPLP
eukprot:8717148-Pyramimonas_sp.AAC.1